MFDSKDTFLRAREVLDTGSLPFAKASNEPFAGPPPHCHTKFDPSRDNEFTSEAIELKIGGVRTKVSRLPRFPQTDR